LITFPTKISREKPFSPSKISFLDECKLNYLLQTENIGNKSPSGQHAFFGTAIHSTIEHLLNYGHSPEQAIKALFLEKLANALLKSNDSSPLLAWTINKNGISSVYDNVRIISALQQLKKLTSSYAGVQFTAQQTSGQKNEVLKNQLGTERTFEVKALDISGNIDLSYRDINNVIHVVDFKSGKILDDDSKLKKEYDVQISLYGLMVSEHFLGCDIILEVQGPREQWNLPFDLNLKKMLTKKMEMYKQDMPLGIEFSIDSMATLGEHCSVCRSRSSCPKYFDILRHEAVNDSTKFLSKSDICGEILEIHLKDEFIELRIKSVNNVVISIAGLPKEIFSNLITGMTIACFNLKYYDHEALCRFPANFYVYRPDIPKHSAFEALILVQG
jgi:hypothetical protein